MNLDNIGNIIKKIREESKMSQTEFGEKYNISAQAVSKWERGLSIPDISILNQISKDYNISIDEILNGTINENKKNKFKLLYFIIIGLILILTIIFIHYYKSNNFDVKFISTTCNNFNISGIVAYNEKKSSIYVSGLTYCGEEEDTTIYQNIECTLYEKHDATSVAISTINANKKITLKDFLKDITFKIDNYSKMCKDYHEESLYLEINAININNKITKYIIPLELQTKCN